jgi:MFS family permease
MFSQHSPDKRVPTMPIPLFAILGKARLAEKMKQIAWSPPLQTATAPYRASGQNGTFGTLGIGKSPRKPSNPGGTERLGFALGWLSIGQLVGSLVGPLIGGALADATRRDFLDGIAVTAAVGASPRVLIAGDPERTSPPAPAASSPSAISKPTGTLPRGKASTTGFSSRNCVKR